MVGFLLFTFPADVGHEPREEERPCEDVVRRERLRKDQEAAHDGEDLAHGGDRRCRHCAKVPYETHVAKCAGVHHERPYGE